MALLTGLLITATSGYTAEHQSPSLPLGLKASVWASENLLANPVSISFDSNNRLYVAEAHRKNTGVWGVTFSRWWAMEDYQASTLADREAMYERWAHVIPEHQLREQTDLIRVIEDTNNDGVADESEVFSSDYDHPLDGNAAGILALDDSILFTCIPHLWKLQDKNQDRKAELKQALHKGFGVRVGVHGHDLHGLIQGPDGMIYFTVGDRGYDVVGHDGIRLHESHCGAVFRCYPDGSHLEVFHQGLRNPQELAFNDYGDLFTVDNNMSGGDECRILHLLEGADSGWDATYQLAGHFRSETKRPNHPKPIWFSEKLWSKPFPGQPHWHNPAVGHLSRGPSGLAHYPGTGLSDEYQDTFFLADFVGNQANSGILSFKLASNGASYRLEKSERFVWNILATDLEFGNDGSLYISDWLNGWTGTGKGRIWKVESSSNAQDHSGSNQESIKTRSYSSLDATKLGNLLGHRNRNVRYRAQFELANRNKAGIEAFRDQLLRSTNPLARIHALWGLGQLAEKLDPRTSITPSVIIALKANHPEVRAQAAKMIGNLSLPANQSPALLILLEDESPRVVYQAMMSATKLKLSSATPATLKILQSDRADDPAIRHAGVSYLSALLKPSILSDFSHHPNRRLRESAVLALRRLKSPLIEPFLKDAEPEIVFETIRAIHDLPIPELQERLASFSQEQTLHGKPLPFPITHRILNTNFRIGTTKHAKRISEIAVNQSLSFEIRLEALESLRQWNHPSVFDRVTWNLRPHTETRERNIGPWVRKDLLATFSEFLDQGNKPAQPSLERAMTAIAQILIDHDLIDERTAEKGIHREEIPVAARIQFLRHLIENKSLSIAVAESLLSDPEPQIQAVSAAALVETENELGWGYFERSITSTNTDAIQHSLSELAHIDSERRTRLLNAALERAAMSAFPKHAWLDLYEISVGLPESKLALSNFLKSQLEGNELGIAALSIEGGDPGKGASLFQHHPAQCLRCHQVGGFGGSAGPDLSKVGKALNRQEILESLLIPNKRIAPGFETTTLDLSDGEVISGIVQLETDQDLILRMVDRSIQTVSKHQISHRNSQQSSMPPMGGVLSRQELRDLVSYLANQK
ncbi:HEAT repeat domain-containing protein [Verrucomicrobia bacterium]|nr:HEAT repeat domain-containing protein [Verrucomicrobiota bacterium]